MLNKRGQELTTGTIILIVLGVVLLVFLIYGFSVGWTNLFERLTNVGGTSQSAVIMGCAKDCATKSAVDYNRRREMTLETPDKKKVKLEVTCKLLENGFADESIIKRADVNCVFFNSTENKLVKITAVTEKSKCNLAWDSATNECKLGGVVQGGIIIEDCEAFWIPKDTGWREALISPSCSI